jgi:hypothetical protein
MTMPVVGPPPLLIAIVVDEATVVVGLSPADGALEAIGGFWYIQRAGKGILYGKTLKSMFLFMIIKIFLASNLVSFKEWERMANGKRKIPRFLLVPWRKIDGPKGRRLGGRNQEMQLAAKAEIVVKD